jgi:hypothetical protein
MSAVALQLGEVFGILTVLTAKLAERAVSLDRAIAGFVRAFVVIGRELNVMGSHDGASASALACCEPDLADQWPITS